MCTNRKMTDDCIVYCGQVGYQARIDLLTIGKIVVDGVVFGRQFGEEQLRQVCYSLVLILKALRHLTKLPLDLDHTVQDEMGQYHEGVLLDDEISVGETLVQLVAILVNDVVERDGDVAQRNDDIASNVGIL